MQSYFYVACCHGYYYRSALKWGTQGRSQRGRRNFSETSRWWWMSWSVWLVIIVMGSITRKSLSLIHFFKTMTAKKRWKFKCNKLCILTDMICCRLSIMWSHFWWLDFIPLATCSHGCSGTLLITPPPRRGCGRSLSRKWAGNVGTGWGSMHGEVIRKKATRTANLQNILPLFTWTFAL